MTLLKIILYSKRVAAGEPDPEGVRKLVAANCYSYKIRVVSAGEIIAYWIFIRDLLSSWCLIFWYKNMF